MRQINCSRCRISIAGATLLVAMLFTGIPSLAPNSSAATTQTTGVLVPLFAYPTAPIWQSIIQEKQSNPTIPIIAVVNPDNGPGYYQDPVYVQAIDSLRSVGIIVIGYVYTSYGARSQSDVISDINSYRQWYGMNGIFFDEMANVEGYESYYSTLSNYARSLGYTITVGNSGTGIAQSYVGIMNFLIVYEDQGLPSLSHLSGLTSGYSRSNFALVAYGVSNFDSSYILSVSNYVAWMYITSANQPNPYNVLPYYFSNLLAVLTGVPPNTVQVTVHSVGMDGLPLNGLWTTVQSQSGNILTVGFTPLVFTAALGETYVINVSDYQNNLFDHWENMSGSASIAISPTHDTLLIAYYRTGMMFGIPENICASFHFWKILFGSAPIIPFCTLDY
ncbi:MAG: spherulation-specific family 4 protein [Nitrososphaerota archaeon]|nr:spherulation-specific family 4 protein [Nitrososphaerota archaeon]